MKTIIIFLTVVVITTTLELPSTFKICHKSHPKLSKCLGETAEITLKNLVNGLKSFNIEPLDPLKINKTITVMIQWLKLEYRNSVIYGLTNIKVLDFQVDWDKFIFKIKSFSPQIKVVSDYNVEGRLLLLPIQGKGKSNTLLNNLTIYTTMHFEKYEKDGEIFAKTTNITLSINPQKTIIHFDNLFNENVILGERINEVINSNSELVFKEFKQPYEVVLIQKLQDVTNKIFNNVPFNKLILN